MIYAVYDVCVVYDVYVLSIVIYTYMPVHESCYYCYENRLRLYVISSILNMRLSKFTYFTHIY